MPAPPAFAVTPLQDEVIGGKYKLKKRSFVTILVTELHRDPTIWGPNPDAFNPDNFSREAEMARPTHAWKPFGNGQRACIGRGFAMHEAALCIGMILQRFKLIDHERYQLKLKETLSIKPDGFKLKVRPRSDKDRTQSKGTASVATGAATPTQAAVARPGHNTPLLVLYGSNLGTAEDIATRLADTAELNGFATTLAPMDEFVGKLPQKGAVVMVCASYNGAPPDNATKFVQWLDGQSDPEALKGVNYCVFGCGNSDWAATYQTVPRLIDDKLATLGARRVMERGEGDAKEDIEGHFESWFNRLRPVAAKEFGLDTAFTEGADSQPLYSIEPVAPAIGNVMAAAAGAHPMTIVVNRELQAEGSDRSTRHIEVQLPAGLTYRVGDHLSVVPVNELLLADKVARRFGFRLSDHIRLTAAGGRRSQLPVGEVISVGRLLTEFVELQDIATRKQIQTMAEHTRCPMTKPKLLAFTGDDAAASAAYRSEIFSKRKSVYDLMEEFPACELPFHVYLEMLSLLSPRYYSISSSPAGDPQRCSITSAVVEAPALSGRGLFRGVCSNFLASRREGDTIHATIRETKAGFHLPEDMAKPIIMIGPGTGLAPSGAFCRSVRPARPRARRSGLPCCFSAAATRIRTFSIGTS